MVEIRIELVEVDSPGGAVIGSPLAAMRTDMLDTVVGQRGRYLRFLNCR